MRGSEDYTEEDEDLRWHPGYAYYLVAGVPRLLNGEEAEVERQRGKKEGFLIVMIDETAMSLMHI